MGSAIPSVNFSSDFSLGVEEELLLVDRATHALDHGAVDILGRMSVAEGGGGVHPDYYAAMIELAAPICSGAAEAISSLNALRTSARAVGATAIGAGLHPTGAFGDVIPYPAPRYRLIADEMRGLQARTPTCALHVHVGMPDEEAAIRAFNGVREYLVWRVLDDAFDWFRLVDGQYVLMEPDARGVIESREFPGLRLNVPGLLAGDLATVSASPRKHGAAAVFHQG